jgi:hypothetical protein
VSRLVKTPVTREHASYVVRNLRDRDRREIFALRWDDDEDSFVRDIVGVAGVLWNAWLFDNEPVALNGCTPIRPGVVNAGAFGTDKWRYAVRGISRETFRVIPLLQHAGYHRGETYAMAANAEGRRWIEMMGARKEAYLHKFGRNREDFILYTWRLDEDVFQLKNQLRDAIPVLPDQQRAAGGGGTGPPAGGD